MIEDIQVDNPTSRIPQIPPWTDVSRSNREDFSPSSLPSSAIPENSLRQRFEPAASTPWDYEFTVNSPPSQTVSFPFSCSYSAEDGTISVAAGSYEYPLGTNTDVEATPAAAGQYAYLIIKQLEGGGLSEFTVEVSSTTKDPTNRDAGDTFVEYSNVLLAGVVGTGDAATLVQRRLGNVSLIYRLINGAFCLWPETTGGTTL